MWYNIYTVSFTSKILIPMISFELFDTYSVILESLSFWSTIVVALAMTIAVGMLSRSMRGGVFGTVLFYFSGGMFFIFLGFIANTGWFQGVLPSLVFLYGPLYIAGFALMGVGANKLLKVIKG